MTGERHGLDAIFETKNWLWRLLNRDAFEKVFGVSYADPKAQEIVLEKLNEITEENNRLYHLNLSDDWADPKHHGLSESHAKDVAMKTTARHFGFTLDPPETKVNREG
jgi:hypothetical protein